MTPVGSIASAFNSLGVDGVRPATEARPGALPDGLAPAGAPSRDGFSNLLDSVVSGVNGVQAQAEAATTKVLLGDSGQLHQSVIAMQEASTALSLMVAVRNKLVESYQELMRMQV